MTARFAHADYSGAVTAGALAIRLSDSVGDWDTFGNACNTVGAGHLMLKQYEQAEKYLHAYLSKRHLVKQYPELQSNVWYNLSLVHKALNQTTESIEALTNALAQARLTRDPRRVFGMTLSLVDALLKAGQLDQIPRLLAQSARYLRNQSLTAGPQVSYHLTYRAEFALETERIQRARLLAVKGLTVSKEDFRHQFSFHMLLARIEKASNSFSIALNHAWSARACAVKCQRSDLEAQALTTVDQLLNRLPS